MPTMPQRKRKVSFLKILILLILFGRYWFCCLEICITYVFRFCWHRSYSNRNYANPSGNAPKAGNPVVSLPTFTVNLADPLGRRYIRLTLEVEVNSEDAAAELTNSTAKVRDAINLLLSSKSYADLAL